MAHGIAVFNEGTTIISGGLSTEPGPDSFTEYSSSGILPAALIDTKFWELELADGPRSYTFTYTYNADDEGVEFFHRHTYLPYLNTLNVRQEGRNLIFDLTMNTIPAGDRDPANFELLFIVAIFRRG